MGTKRWKPMTPGTRFKISPDFNEITREHGEKSLMAPLKRTAGRNSYGRVTARHRGGGHKRMYRIIDFKRNKPGVPGTVSTIEYDPNRSARIALVVYADGEKRYILCPVGLSVGDSIMAGPGAAPEVGNHLPLENIPVGTMVHNVELKPGKGGQMARSAGTAVQLMAREQVRNTQASLQGDAQGTGKLRCHHWDRRKRRAQPHRSRQGGSQPLAGPQTPCPRCCHEPHRPSHGWRRGQNQWWTPSLFTLGSAGQGPSHKEAQEKV